MIALNLPENAILPAELHTFTQNENLIMILVGFHAINVMKKNFIHQNLTLILILTLILNLTLILILTLI